MHARIFARNKCSWRNFCWRNVWSFLAVTRLSLAIRQSLPATTVKISVYPRIFVESFSYGLRLHYSGNLRIGPYKRFYGTGSIKIWKNRHAQNIRGYRPTDILQCTVHRGELRPSQGEGFESPTTHLPLGHPWDSQKTTEKLIGTPPPK